MKKNIKVSIVSLSAAASLAAFSTNAFAADNPLSGLTDSLQLPTDLTSSIPTDLTSSIPTDLTSSTSSIPTDSTSSLPTSSLTPTTPTDPETPVNPTTKATTHWVDENGKELVPAQAGYLDSKEITGYVLIRSHFVAEGEKLDGRVVGDLYYYYSGMTTVNFTANFNDGTTAHFTWTFPAETKVTYAQLFEMAGLNPNDFDLASYNMTGDVNK